MYLNEDGTLPAFTWLGAYPCVYYLGSDELCPSCAQDAYTAGETGLTQDVHWEGDPIVCCQCDAAIEPAYPDD
jgi:hypothetical protein